MRVFRSINLGGTEVVRLTPQEAKGRKPFQEIERREGFPATSRGLVIIDGTPFFFRGMPTQYNLYHLEGALRAHMAANPCKYCGMPTLEKIRGAVNIRTFKAEWYPICPSCALRMRGVGEIR